MAETWSVGETGYYVLPPSATYKRPTTLYLAVKVTRVNGSIITVRPLNGRSGHKVTKAKCLTKLAPEGAWTK